ncbi:MAG TPA: DinB family protein [Terriglobales bacterium]
MTLTTTTFTATASLRPQPGEYAPYYDRYISLVYNNDAHGNDILAALDDQRRETLLLLSGRTEADGELRYAPDKWSLKEVLGHINDTERIMSYRALHIARGDQTPIAGFEQDDYVRNGQFGRVLLADLIEDYIAVRRATISLFRNLDEPAGSRRGVANKNEITVRALAYVIAGHELHHRSIIEEKYLK